MLLLLYANMLASIAYTLHVSLCAVKGSGRFLIQNLPGRAEYYEKFRDSGCIS